MLSLRILNTLRFFDLQDIPLSLFELHKFLLRDNSEIKIYINTEFEVIGSPSVEAKVVDIDKVLFTVENELFGQIEAKNGYFCLPGRSFIIDSRINNYYYGFLREKRINRFLWFLKYIPFVRASAILGSQALGQPKIGSDIDLFIVTDPEFLGLARSLVTAFFQMFGVRRHGKNIANRFCLNHYLAGVRPLPGDRNLYTAMEYLKLRPVAGFGVWAEFLSLNPWVNLFFPNAKILTLAPAFRQPLLQKFFEKLFKNSFGRFLENKIKTAQLGRIQKGEFIVADSSEMSFHPNNRKSLLFGAFFEGQ